MSLVRSAGEHHWNGAYLQGFSQFKVPSNPNNFVIIEGKIDKGNGRNLKKIKQ